MKKINGLLKTAEDASRDFTDDELDQFNSLKAEVAECDSSLERLDEIDRLNAEGSRQQAADQVPGRQPIVGDPANKGLSDRERQDLDKFSFTSFLNGAVNRAKGTANALDGVELEMAQEAEAQATAAGTSLEGIGVPQMILTHRTNAHSVTGGSGNQGGDFVDTELRSMIDYLKDSMELQRLGATFIGGLQGDVTWPRVIDGQEPTEKTETANADERQLTTDLISATPHRLPVTATYSKQLLVQSSEDVEAYLRQDLMSQIALRYERQALNGDGVGANILGLLNTPGIGAVIGGANGAAPTEAHLIDLEGEVDIQNALMGSLNYYTNPRVKKTLKKTAVEDGQTARLWGKDNVLNTYANPGNSNLMPSNLTKGSGTNLSALVFGNWADLLLNQWGGLDVIVNPFSLDTSGQIRITVATFVDALVRRAASFAAMKDVITD